MEWIIEKVIVVAVAGAGDELSARDYSEEELGGRCVCWVTDSFIR